MRRQLFSFLSATVLTGLWGYYCLPGQAYRDTDACRRNVGRLSWALSTYALDHAGAYPEQLSDLVPQYLSAVPTCPACGEMTYRWELRRVRPEDAGGFPVAWRVPEVYCSGHHHPLTCGPDQPCVLYR